MAGVFATASFGLALRRVVARSVGEPIIVQAWLTLPSCFANWSECEIAPGCQNAWPFPERRRGDDLVLRHAA
jgi:hypothetical protein